MLHLGYGKSYEKFSSTPICHIFSNFPAVFHNAQVTNRHFLKHGSYTITENCSYCSDNVTFNDNFISIF